MQTTIACRMYTPSIQDVGIGKGTNHGWPPFSSRHQLVDTSQQKPVSTCQPMIQIHYLVTSDIHFRLWFPHNLHRSPINHTVKTTPCGEPVFRSTPRQYTPVKDASRWYVIIQCRQYVRIWLARYIIFFGVWLYMLETLDDPFFHWNRFVFRPGALFPRGFSSTRISPSENQGLKETH